MNVFVTVELFYLFNCRSLTKSMFSLGLFSNRWIVFGVTSMVALYIAFTDLPVMNYLFHTAHWLGRLVANPADRCRRLLNCRI